jgi:hypothetical protein
MLMTQKNKKIMVVIGGVFFLGKIGRCNPAFFPWKN